MAIPQIECANWDDLARQLDRLDGWIFRGQASSEWPLTSSLERCTPPDQSRDDVERQLAGGFRRRAHNHLDAAKMPRTPGEWLVLMQHYGAPTRLVDFTESPFVAAYFAFEEQGPPGVERCAVWAVSAAWCDFNLTLIAERKSGLFGRTYQTIREEALKRGDLKKFVGRNVEAYLIGFHIAHLVEAAATSNESLMVAAFQPDRLSERMLAQRGIFLWPGRVDATFMENLAAMENAADGLRQFVIPTTERGRALEQLRKMNITRSSLFPGFEGFARSFRYLPIRESEESRMARIAQGGDK
jgi:hypothetical protein